jgi:hypothetical protein
MLTKPVDDDVEFRPFLKQSYLEDKDEMSIPSPERELQHVRNQSETFLTHSEMTLEKPKPREESIEKELIEIVEVEVNSDL